MVCVFDCQMQNCDLSVQMQFRYAQKGADGQQLFEIGVVLARQYLGEGQWEVWDLRPGCKKWCQACSSAAERLVRHDNGPCPKALTRRALGVRRSAARRKATADARAAASGQAPPGSIVQADAVAEPAEDSSESDYQPSGPRSRVVVRKPPGLAPPPSQKPPRKGPTVPALDGARPKRRQPSKQPRLKPVAVARMSPEVAVEIAAPPMAASAVDAQPAPSPATEAPPNASSSKQSKHSRPKRNAVARG